MKTHKEISDILNRTLEFIIDNVESKKDYIMLKDSMKDYREMGYSIEKFQMKYGPYLNCLEEIYENDEFRIRGVYNDI